MNHIKKLSALALGAGLISSGQAAVYASNGNSGFGGVLSSLEITDDGTTITATLTRGAGDLNDAFVLYIDSTVGGSNDTSAFTDSGDTLRSAISGFNGTNRATVTTPVGFGIDYALALDSGFGGLWQTVDSGSHTFVDAAAAAGGTTAATYTMTFDFAEIGLASGQPFNFVGTYLNANDAFRSDEAFGGGIAAGNPGQNAVTFSSNLTYTPVPEPSSALLGSLALLGLLGRRR